MGVQSNYILGIEPVTHTPLVPRFRLFEEALRCRGRDPDGIGFIGLPYIRDAKALAISEGNGEGVLEIEPSRKDVIFGTHGERIRH